ncbi:MAG: efflux RND transporter periplasmic adaptor subunit [Vicinamibacterales bacterium]
MLRVFRHRRVLLALLVVGALLAVALWPTSLEVDTTTVVRGPLVVTVDEEGETRVRDRFVVSAPVTGRVMRIELEPGDRVARGDVVARVAPESPALLDERTHAEMAAAVSSARAVVGRSSAEAERANVTLAAARRELDRVRALRKEGAISEQEFDKYETDVQVAERAADAAAFAVRTASAELQRAEARLTQSSPVSTGRVMNVVAPVPGVVLRRVRESESIVPAGDPLLEIGDPGQLEIVSDLLSTDAVRVKPGARALIEQWGGDGALEARVRRVEPSGFTKLSALGVEEQRVNVILDFANPSEAVAALGDAYRVEVRVVIWEAESVLTIPTGALFRSGTAWAVYAVEDGRAQLRSVSLGHRTGQIAEITSGLVEGTVVVVHPGDTLTSGARVVPRQ